jgi:ParB-like chromosome segregation protein Spo0J
MKLKFIPETIQMWPIHRLIPYAQNARRHSDEQVRQIAASIKEFGFTNPILVDSAAGVVAGHARLAAAQTLALLEVPVIVLDHLTDTQKRAYIRADNKLAENATWDESILRAEIEALAAVDFDLPLIGFSEFELETLRGALDCPALVDEDDSPALQPWSSHDLATFGN